MGAVICAGLAATQLRFPDVVDAFTFVSPAFVTPRNPSAASTSTRFVSSTHNPPPTSLTPQNDDGDDDSEMSDEELLRVTPTAQLADLCVQFSLDSRGTKATLLQRLRDHAKAQAEKERERLERRRERVDKGGEDDRERFEIVESESNDEDDAADDDAVFYYHSRANSANTTSVSIGIGEKSNFSGQGDSEKRQTPAMSSQAKLTAPPPPPIEPDENGERVVTIYSTTDHNDLTGIAAAQPGQAAQKDPMISGGSADPINAPWDTNNPQKRGKETPTASELEAAKAEVSELVHTLLAISGAPGFQQDDDDELSSLMGGVVRRPSSAFSSPEGFIGFDPAVVPTDMLTKASKSLRTGRGSVLAEVMREFELRAVGYDGIAGDDKDRGGGHYRQVSKVRSFLDGFRIAEVRRLARDTATMLLDKLVGEGIEGLDIALATMARSSDETSDEAGELNDSLLDYLNDSIRQQEKKVEQLVDSVKKVTELENTLSNAESTLDEDTIEKLWTVDTTDEGQRVETFDPKNLKSQNALREELAQELEKGSSLKPITPKSAPEQLLLLLTLLRERVKTEAAFSHDEKSRNLRVLAYCLNLNSDNLRKDLIMREFGSSIDRLDSFAELIASSIEYAESTSHQLQPSKRGPLNVTLLKRIRDITKNIRDMQAWKASGAKNTKSMQ